jgi:4-amino-4-deoxy-L-arabinose transferase-like glycosyltransferase
MTSVHASVTTNRQAFDVRISTAARLWVLLAVYLLAHWELWHRISAPTYGWRPTDLAGIAINYYRNGFHFFYPQVMWGGAGAGHVEMEFPLQPFLTALLFKVFGQHDALCNVVPLLSGFGIVWVTTVLGRYLFGDIAGLAAGVTTAVSPTLVNITSYGMWADPPMVFFGALGIYWLLRWADGASSWRLWAGAASIALAILLKITGLYLGVVVLYLFVRRYGLQFLRKPATWLTAAAILIPPVLWYAHAYRMYLEDGNTFGILAAGSLKFGTTSTLTDLYIYRRTAIRIVLDHLTPLGFLAFAYGLYLSFIRREAFVFVWLGAVALHALVSFRGIQYAGHIGYLLTILPVCNPVGGLGFQTALAGLRRRLGDRLQAAMLVPLIAAFSVLVIVNVAGASAHFNHRDLGFEDALWKGKQLTGFKVAELTRPGSLIVVADHQMDGLTPQTWMTPPDVFFFGQRRGWYLTLSYVTPQRIEDLRTKGAEYFVVSANSLVQYADKYSALDAYLSQNFRKINDQDGIIYDLRQ